MSDFANLLAYIEAMEDQVQPSGELLKIRPASLPLLKKDREAREKANKEAMAKLEAEFTAAHQAAAMPAPAAAPAHPTHPAAHAARK